MSFVHFLHSDVGLKEIQELTKQSLRSKPFCLAIGKEWEEKQRKMDLRGIHTKLSWTRKHRKASGFKQAKLDDITQILSEQQLGEDGPVRILVEGKSSKQNTNKNSMNEFSCVSMHTNHHNKSNMKIFVIINFLRSIKCKM